MPDINHIYAQLKAHQAQLEAAGADARPFPSEYALDIQNDIIELYQLLEEFLKECQGVQRKAQIKHGVYALQHIVTSVFLPSVFMLAEFLPILALKTDSAFLSELSDATRMYKYLVGVSRFIWENDFFDRTPLVQDGVVGAVVGYIGDFIHMGDRINNVGLFTLERRALDYRYGMTLSIRNNQLWTRVGYRPRDTINTSDSYNFLNAPIPYFSNITLFTGPLSPVMILQYLAVTLHYVAMISRYVEFLALSIQKGCEDIQDYRLLRKAYEEKSQLEQKGCQEIVQRLYENHPELRTPQNEEPSAVVSTFRP